jgi:hypothetical protein
MSTIRRPRSNLPAARRDFRPRRERRRARERIRAAECPAVAEGNRNKETH